MPRSIGTLVSNDLSKGLITEANPLKFPENACTETLNCVHDTSGYVYRRPNFEYEDNYELHTFTRSSSVIQEFVWETVAGDGFRTFVVTQIGSTISFYDASTGEISNNLKPFEIDLTDYQDSADTEDMNEFYCQFTNGKGYLFVSHPRMNPLLVVYDLDTDDIVVTEITIQIRDFAGEEDGLEVDERPLVQTDEHFYNLYNQGWGAVATTDSSNEEVVYDRWVADVVSGELPSNADVWWVMKNVDDEFNAGDRNSTNFGNTPAPKGHYVLDAFNQDKTEITGVTLDLDTLSSGFLRPTCIAFFSGRVWYAGVAASKFSSNIYFSQIVERDEQVGYCYQLQDPTAENAADLLSSDGGVILIQEIGTVYKMIPSGKSLIILASNGIWTISGSGDGSGFKATDYSVSKISSIGSASANSVVEAGTTLLWWDYSGIWSLSSDHVSEVTTFNVADVKSLSQDTIQTEFEGIPAQAVRYAKGAYNPVTKIVQWVYKITELNDIDNIHNYFRILNLDLNTGAFYVWTIQGGVKLNGILCLKIPESTSQVGYRTYYHTSRSVNIDDEEETDYNFTFSICEATDYFDWIIATPPNGITYESTFTTGYRLDAQADKDFQDNYVTVHMAVEEDDEDNPAPSLFLVGKWDFSVDSTSNRETTPQQLYRYNDNFLLTTRKVKLRGHGKALQLRFYGETNKPFKVYGWSVMVTGNSRT